MTYGTCTPCMVLLEAIKMMFAIKVFEYFFTSYIKQREGSQIRICIKWVFLIMFEAMQRKGNEQKHTQENKAIDISGWFLLTLYCVRVWCLL